MTFVKVKDHEWLDLERRISMGIREVPSGFSLYLLWSSDDRSDTYFDFPTLEEALTAAEKIIGSCEPKRAVDIQAVDTLDTILGIK